MIAGYELLNKTTLDVVDLLKKEPCIKSIVLVGSIIIKKNFNDYDLLVLHDKASDFNMIRDLLGHYNIIHCDDSLRLIFEQEKDINIALYTYSDFFEKVKSIFKPNQPTGEHREWAMGYWIPEMLIQDIEMSQVIYDSNSLYKDIFNYIMENKQGFNDIVIKKCTDEFVGKLNLIKTNDNILNIAMLRNDILLALMRVYAIKNFRYISGFKNFKQEMINLKDDDTYSLLEEYSIATQKQKIIFLSELLYEKIIKGGSLQ